MKKLIKLLLVIFIIILIFELIIYIFKKNHDIEYKIKNNNNEYTVHEIYKDKHYYIKISKGSYKYAFELEDDFSKSKKIISKIHDFNTKNVLCIYPETIKKTNMNIVCSKDNNSYSYNQYKEDLKDFVKDLKKKGFESESWEDEDDTRKKIDNVTVYVNNINDNTYIFIYKYDGFFSINADERTKIDLFKEDVYNNNLGFAVSKYYIIPDYDQKHDYTEFYKINMVNNKVSKVKYKKSISKDSYINGIIDNEAYIFDKDELKQYKIYSNGRKIKEVGNKEDGVLYYDLKFTDSDVYTFRDKEMIFKTVEDYISKIEKETSINFIRKDNDSYYYQTKDNNVYYYNLNSSQKVLLFNAKITDFILIDNHIYFISEDTLYSYSQSDGMKKLLSYSELSFNTKNRLAIYKR